MGKTLFWKSIFRGRKAPPDGRTGTRKRSASDNDRYPEVALKAAQDLRSFASFRSNRTYRRILEHVKTDTALKYLDIIRNEYGLSEEQILEIIEPLQMTGGPKLVRLEGLSFPVSTTALRYLKVALDIRDQCGERIGTVSEIGCGYGGQSIILGRVVRIEHYRFFDIWQVNELVRRFIEAVDTEFTYEISTLKQLENPVASDLVLSNYAFSELPEQIQVGYLQKVIGSAGQGYMTMNSGVDGAFSNIENLSQSELLSRIPNSEIIDERPCTGNNNFILRW